MNYIIILFASFFGLCLLGVPVAVSLGVSAMLTGISCGITPIFLVQQMFSMINSYTLLAIPLFLLVGNIMEYGQITERLVAFAASLVGHIRGGLGQVNVLANMIMAGISGSANADAAALGSMMIPVMKKEGYPADMAAAINACASTMGPVIPPSMLMVVYGAYGGVSVASMFLAGFVPGFLIALFMMITIYYWAKKYPSIKKREKRASLKEIWRTFKNAFLALMVPVIIIVGVLGGTFTATESGMIAAVYCLIVTTFIYKQVRWKQFVSIIKKTLTSMAAPMFCAAGAGAFGYMIAYLQIPKLILQMSGPINGDRYLTLIFLFILFLLLGCFMDAIPAIMIFLPIVQELSNAAGLDPLHVATLVVVTLCFGFVTPPYGLTMLLSSSIAGVESTAVIKRTVPFYLTFLAVGLILIFLPQVFLFLPNVLM